MKKVLWLIVCLMTMIVNVKAQSYTRKDIKDINFRIIVLEADSKSSLSEIDMLKSKRDEMVNTFSIADKTINFGMTQDEAKKVMDICGHWSKHSASFTEEGEIELIHFDVFNSFYLKEKELTNDNNYMLTFVNGKLKQINVAENTADKLNAKIRNLKYKVRSIVY